MIQLRSATSGALCQTVEAVDMHIMLALHDWDPMA